MKKRILTAIAMIAVVVLMFFVREIPAAGLYIFDVVLAIGLGYAVYEMSKLLSKMGFYNNLYVACCFPIILLVTMLLCIDSSLPLYLTIITMLSVMILVALLTFLFYFTFRKVTKKEMVLRKSIDSLNKFSFKISFNTALTFIYPTFFFMFFIFINHFGALSSQINAIESFSSAALIMLLSCLIIPCLTDTFAMLTGSVIGGKKLCPKISPNKTISGAIGGFLWTILLSACFYLILDAIPSIHLEFLAIDFFIWKYLIIAAIASIVAQLGDLFESILKRRAGVKDSGTLLPGHGGLLDRIDSYIYTAPVIFILFIIFLL